MKLRFLSTALFAALVSAASCDSINNADNPTNNPTLPETSEPGPAATPAPTNLNADTLGTGGTIDTTGGSFAQ